MRFIFLNILFFLSLQSAVSQPGTLYQDYVFNRFSASPAYAGQTRGIQAMVSYRKYWMGFPGTPQILSIAVDGAYKNTGVGLILSNEKQVFFQILLLPLLMLSGSN